MPGHTQLLITKDLKVEEWKKGAPGYFEALAKADFSFRISKRNGQLERTRLYLLAIVDAGLSHHSRKCHKLLLDHVIKIQQEKRSEIDTGIIDVKAN